jgi:purine-binding chemotaxis protein CheW
MILVGSGISSDLSSGLAVLCRVGSVVCALPAEHVSETMRPLPVEPLAGMPPFIAGLAIVRGVPIPVVDLARLLGGSDPLRATRFVTIRIGDRHAAMAVDSVLGVRAVRADALHELPPLLGGAGADAVDAVGTLDANLVLVLRSARIVPPVVWEALATTVPNARNGEGTLS